MPVAASYRINTPHVISEIIDGEAVILNFESGSYYSLNESGMAVWEKLQLGRSGNTILLDLQKRYGTDQDSIKADLAELLETLLAEQLIVTAPATEAAIENTQESPPIPYTKPALEKFTDLQELLLLDPIHDVDESGWPHHSP